MLPTGGEQMSARAILYDPLNCNARAASGKLFKRHGKQKLQTCVVPCEQEKFSRKRGNFAIWVCHAIHRINFTIVLLQNFIDAVLKVVVVSMCF